VAHASRFPQFQREILSFPDSPDPVDCVRGDGTGLAIPAHGEALGVAGAAFLTDAFRSFGSLCASNRIVRITRCEPFFGGNSGQKLFLSVEYAHAEPGLHRDLFVKFSRDFTDPFRDRRRHELEAEVRFAALSRLPSFPIHVPTPAQLRELIERYAAFAARCPQLLPANVTTPEFISTLERDAPRFLRHAATIKRFLHADRDFIALCHYNANIDNAWFWRDHAGALQCGLLDWGRVRQMNVAYALWGCLCGAGLEIWDEHLDELLVLFTGELHARGGPLLDVTQIRLYLDFYAATMGLAVLIQAPALVLSRLPEAANAYSPLDPVFGKNEVARGFLHVFTAFLNLWQTHDFGASLDWLLRNEPT
jgi:hypothetical protein